MNVSFGSSSRDLKGSTTNLYIGNQLAGTVQMIPAQHIYVLFLDSTASGLIGANPVHVDDALLTSFFSGTQSGTLEIIPTFTSGSGMVNFGGWAPHAMTSFGQITQEHVLPGPTTLSSRIVSIDVPAISAVPEPETYAMMLAGLVLVGAMARRRKLAKI